MDEYASAHQVPASLDLLVPCPRCNRNTNESFTGSKPTATQRGLIQCVSST